jgi:hypothetical protein
MVRAYDKGQTIRNDGILEMDRTEAQQYYNQCRENLRAYPEKHSERLKYEKKMAELVKRFPGIENK